METMINYRRKRGYALALACLVYALFMTLFLVELHLNVSSDSSLLDPLINHKNPPFSPRLRKKGPAPVRYVSQPKQKTAPTQATPEKPVPKPTETKTVQNKPTPPKHTASKKNLPKKVAPKIEIKKEKPEPKKNNEIPRYKKRSKNKWFRKPTEESKAEPQKQQRMTPNQFASQLSQGFSNYVTKKHAEEAHYTVPDIKGTTDAVEYEMFVGKMVHAVCDASHLKPLKPHTSMVKAHSIIIKITCDKNRKISDISLMQPSYDKQINTYLIGLLENIHPPQLPKAHPAPKLTIPLRINIERQHNAQNIRLIPS